MVGLVALFQTSENCHRVFHTGFTHENLLESPLQGSVLFDEFTIFIQSGCPNKAQFSSGQHGFEHVGRGNRTFATTCAHQGVQLINKSDDLTFGVVDFFQDCFEAFFELASVFSARNNGRHVERN